MRAAQILRPGEGIVTNVDVPTPEADDVLIKVRSAGICGTDLHIFKGEYEAVYPLIPGHEFSGEVVAVGENVTNFRVGDRVTADPNIPCNRCPNCQRIAIEEVKGEGEERGIVFGGTTVCVDRTEEKKRNRN